MKWRRACFLITVCLMMIFLTPGGGLGAGAGKDGEDKSVSLKLIPVSETEFTNALMHYVYFNAETENAEKLSIRVLSPTGEPVGFRNQRKVEKGQKAVNRMQVTLRKKEQRADGLNVQFKSECMAGRWQIEVTASAEKRKSVTQVLEVNVLNPAPLDLGQLEETHSLMIGDTEASPVNVEEGKVRYICQDPEDPLFVKEYWLSKKYDLRGTANQKCSRAVFSMALSYLGIDCTPVRMSELLWGNEVFYTFDPICEALGNVERAEGTLEELWEKYESGEGSPVLLHFTYDEGMHALLLVNRDRNNPEMYYAVTSGQRVNTSLYPDGRWRDPVIPILIEKGEIGEWIQSPMLDRYHKGRIDEIWQWRRTDTTH